MLQTHLKDLKQLTENEVYLFNPFASKFAAMIIFWKSYF
jgi:hypothetical protein